MKGRKKSGYGILMTQTVGQCREKLNSKPWAGSLGPSRNLILILKKEKRKIGNLILLPKWPTFS
jgi:hypothetical protein